MSRIRTRVLGLAFLLTVSGCSRSPHLAGGPIELKEEPTVVRFERPVRSSGFLWEMCFEFDLPRDSHEAGRIHPVLLSTSGQRYPLVESKLDRRGERVVCQIGRVAAIVPGEGAASQEQLITYEAAELSADVPLRLRGLRGGSR